MALRLNGWPHTPAHRPWWRAANWCGLRHWACFWRKPGAVCGCWKRRLKRAVWTYPEPTDAFAGLAGWFAVYPALMDGCWLDGELVQPQPGGFYGGWITSQVEGPFKGDPLHPELV